MDPNDQSVPAEPASNPSPAPAEPVTPAPADPDPKPGTTEEPAAPAADPANPEPAPADPAADPENPKDPAAGDEPTDPNHTPGDAIETGNEPVDIKSMTRAERATYFQQLDAATRKDVEATVNAAYQPQTVDELTQKYIDQGNSDFEAKMLAREEVREQEADINRARAERAELNATLATEATEVLSTVDWLNPNKKYSFDKVASDAATDLYDQLCLTRDDNTAQRDDKGNPIPGTGQIIGATMTPKQFYTLMDTIRSSGSEVAKVAAQKAAEEEMAAVAAPSSNTSQREKDFESKTAAEQRAELQAKGILVT